MTFLKFFKMKKAKILLVGIILILVRVPEAKAVMGDGCNDFHYYTWKGSSITFSNGSLSIHSEKEEIENVFRWYFYKGNIIGSSSGGRYFVLDENDGNITRFNNKDEWFSELNRQKLHPKIYTRWYYSHIGNGDAVTVFLFKGLLFICVFCPPILLIFWIIYRLFEPGLRAFLIMISLPILEIFFSDWFVFSF